MRGGLFFVFLLALASVFACSHDSSVTTTLPSFVISPADGATNVRLDAPVTLTFSSAVDRDLVQRCFHVISESAMTDSTCPDSTMHHGSTMDCRDETLMHHMEQFHSTPGQFAWNGSGTVCTFQPTSMMTASTRYMMHMDGAMMSAMQMHHDGGSMMQGHGGGMMTGPMTMHFTTMAPGGPDGYR